MIEKQKMLQFHMEMKKITNFLSKAGVTHQNYYMFIIKELFKILNSKQIL